MKENLKTSITLPQSLLDILQEEANDRGISRSEWMRQKLVGSENSPSIAEKQNVDAELKKEEVIYKKLRNDHKVEQIKGTKLDNEIKQRTLTYWQTFNSAPSLQAQRAITQGSRPTLHSDDYSNYSKESDNHDVSSYHESSGKSFLRTHFCESRKMSLTLDAYKNVFCPHCGVTI